MNSSGGGSSSRSAHWRAPLVCGLNLLSSAKALEIGTDRELAICDRACKRETDGQIWDCEGRKCLDGKQPGLASVSSEPAAACGHARLWPTESIPPLQYTASERSGPSQAKSNAISGQAVAHSLAHWHTDRAACRGRESSLTSLQTTFYANAIFHPP